MRSRASSTRHRQPDTRQVVKEGLQSGTPHKMSGDQAVVETVSTDNSQKTHLVVMVNGLFGKLRMSNLSTQQKQAPPVNCKFGQSAGRPSNWKYVVSQLEITLDMKHTVLMVSAANSGFQVRVVSACAITLNIQSLKLSMEAGGTQSLKLAWLADLQGH